MNIDARFFPEALTAAAGGMLAHLWHRLRRRCVQVAERDALVLLEMLLHPAGVPAGLVPYIDPVRASNRTGRIVYQFIRSFDPEGVSLVTTTLEQLIASFLQVGLSKIDTKLSPATQQLIDTAVPTLVSTIASVIVDLADNHKATKAATASK